MCTSNTSSKDNHNFQIRNHAAAFSVKLRCFHAAVCTLLYLGLLLQHIVCEDNENSPNKTKFTQFPTQTDAVGEKQQSCTEGQTKEVLIEFLKHQLRKAV